MSIEHSQFNKIEDNDEKNETEHNRIAFTDPRPFHELTGIFSWESQEFVPSPDETIFEFAFRFFTLKYTETMSNPNTRDDLIEKALVSIDKLSLNNLTSNTASNFDYLINYLLGKVTFIRIDYYREKKRNRTVSLDQLLAGGFQIADNEIPYSVDAETLSQVFTTVKSTIDQTIIVLLMEKLSSLEIGNEIGRTQDYVRDRIRRLRNRAKRRYRNKIEEELFGSERPRSARGKELGKTED